MMTKWERNINRNYFLLLRKYNTKQRVDDDHDDDSIVYNNDNSNNKNNNKAEGIQRNVKSPTTNRLTTTAGVPPPRLKSQSKNLFSFFLLRHRYNSSDLKNKHSVYTVYTRRQAKSEMTAISWKTKYNSSKELTQRFLLVESRPIQARHVNNTTKLAFSKKFSILCIVASPIKTHWHARTQTVLQRYIEIIILCAKVTLHCNCSSRFLENNHDNYSYYYNDWWNVFCAYHVHTLYI